MNYTYNNGGNPKGISDCVPRALAITLGLPYYDVAQALAPYTQEGGVNVWATGFLDYMEAQGFRCVESLVSRRVVSMPSNCIAHVDGHFTAIVNGVVQDTIDTRPELVSRYWVRGNRFNVVANGVAKNANPMNFMQALAMRRMLALNYQILTEIYENSN